MKRLLLFGAFSLGFFAGAQFKVAVNAPSSFSAKEAILYTTNGSKDIISSKEIRKSGQWNFTVPKKYLGMMRVYFPETNSSFNLISENRDVKASLDTEGTKIKNVVFSDDANLMMENVQDLQKKNEVIFPALVQIKDYYKESSEFGKALRNEINRLNQKVVIDAAKYPFVNYYNNTYNRFLVTESGSKAPGQDDISNFIYNSDEMLETSSLLRPLLVNFLNAGNRANTSTEVDKLLTRMDVTTQRGQAVLSELIDIFDVYAMASLKEKYLTQAKNLKCTIHDRLATTLKANANVELGATFPNYVFTAPLNTTSKSIYDVKADKKIIFFWSSSCSHCEAELPKLIEKYSQLKAQNIEIIGLSLDSEKASYQNRASVLPWINDSELRGWNSSYAETYNIHATPTYFILDSSNKIIAKPDHVNDVYQFLNMK